MNAFADRDEADGKQASIKLEPYVRMEAGSFVASLTIPELEKVWWDTIRMVRSNPDLGWSPAMVGYMDVISNTTILSVETKKGDQA